VFTWKRITLGVVAAVGPSVLLAFVVGLAARNGPHPFQWDAAAIAGTGVATAVLAAFTGALALATSRDVSATTDLLEIERKRFAKEDEPYVLIGSFRPNDPQQLVGSSLINGGRGAATNIHWEAYWRPESGAPDEYHLDPGKTRADGLAARGDCLLLSGASINIEFVAWVDSKARGSYAVRGAYSDRQGVGPILLGRAPAEGWQLWLNARATDPWWVDLFRSWEMADRTENAIGGKL
jgi:hypothetical protein